MADILSGKDVSAALVSSYAKRAEALRAAGIIPKLAIIRCGDNPSDIAYENGAGKKASAIGVEVEKHLLPEDITKEMLIDEIEKLNADTSVHGVLLFRPLPRPLKPYTHEICNRLLPEKDIDCMTDLSSAGVYEGRKLGFPPCTAEACLKILDHYGIDPCGMRVTVIGRSLIIGKPLSMMLISRDATVTVCHTKTKDVAGTARAADMVVTTAGVLGILTKDYVKPGQIIIDVSINWDPSLKNGSGGIAGDAVFSEVEPIVKAITPVPGGVGSVTSTVLIGHVIEAAEAKV